MILACSALVCLASCGGNSTSETAADSTLIAFSKLAGINVVSVDSASYYYSPEYRLKDVSEPVTVENITSQSDEMKAQFRGDMANCKPFQIYTAVSENDTVYLRYCRDYCEQGATGQVLKPVSWDRLFVPADKFEAVFAELND